MADDEWFRNTTWSDGIEYAFEAKLRRAKNKSQYLRIQGSYLVEIHPSVALDLLGRCLRIGDPLDRAQALVDKATALAVLDRIDEAAEAYVDALTHEENFPNVVTQAAVKFPIFVATRSLSQHDDRALAVAEKASPRLTFPVERFLSHAARALILAARSSPGAAAHARLALDAASEEHSGLRYHSELGLAPASTPTSSGDFAFSLRPDRLRCTTPKTRPGAPASCPPFRAQRDASHDRSAKRQRALRSG